jgi:peptidoglycan hydrolase-like protein with peptidoglycan-binding domain
MALQSNLFKGDPQLEAAATSNPGHITSGARGLHVAKIQRALNLIQGLSLAEDGVYGAGTAAAVLEYKQQRNIVNTSYQSAADNIVGVLTIAALDQEMLILETPAEPVVLHFPAMMWRPIKGPRRV